jgi:uncharacterized protein (DUF1015 family)
MAEICPFSGVRYNQQVSRDLAQVICPPYDIISPQLQEELYRKHEYNFVRIEYNRELPQDNQTNNRYTRAASTIQDWLSRGILQTEMQPALYIHQHHFSSQGRQHKRTSLIARVKLEEWDKRIVRPHENIMPKPKSDRLNMLWACHSNTSQVLSLYEDRGQRIAFLLTACELSQPALNIVDDYGERHAVWVITQSETVRQINDALADQPIYIADGHHRYDSALTYRREQASRAGTVTGEEGFNYVMMSLIDFVDPGLVILPTHRLVRGISRAAMAGLRGQLEAFFDIEEIGINERGFWQNVDSRLTGLGPEEGPIKVGLIGLEPDRALLLTLRNVEAADALMPRFHSDLYRKMDVSVVDHVILEEILGLDQQKQETLLAYEHDRMEAYDRLKSEEYQLLFLLNPIKPTLIKAVADAGDRMPRKSTYFYPKTPAGLVFYRW